MGRACDLRALMGTGLWLVLFAPWVLPSLASAAEPVTVNIIGLDPPLEKNVRAMLTMVRKKQVCLADHGLAGGPDIHAMVPIKVVVEPLVCMIALLNAPWGAQRARVFVS